jgi:hypothetical protein
MKQSKKPAKGSKKTTKSKKLPLDKKQPSDPPRAPLVDYIAGVYAAIINQFFADNNQTRLNQLVGTMLSMTISVMKRYLGDEITVYEIGRALRTMENAAWITPADFAKQQEKANADGRRTKAKMA